MARLIIISLALFFLLAIVQSQQSQGCHPCFAEQENKNCIKKNDEQLDSYMLHMAVHPHLDAFWIFDFQSYYDPKPQEGQVRSYFASNRFNSVKEIFYTTLDVLMKSKQEREIGGPATQRTQRSFFNSEIGFFKRWYSELTPEKKSQVKSLLSTKHWEIVGGGYVEHDEGCAYYDDIIENFQAGLHFLKDQLNYYPRAAISADSFGHSQTTLAILAHLGVEGFFVERSDEHILLQNKTEFLWKAKSANGLYYGALPTHIRWAIHGFQDQFIGGSINQEICQTKAPFIDNMRRETQFLKRILKSNHIMRYFGHDFQRFDDYSYSVIEGFMEKFSMDKCKKVNAVYSNPTEYFMIMMGEVFNKVKPLAVREEDIMPIWDYDSGLYWTGYYTTDPYHKKIYRDTGRFLYAARKAFTPSYLLDPESGQNKDYYNLLENLSQTVSYLQHHDGISCTSKYEVMDKYEKLAQTQIGDIWKVILGDMFQKEFPPEINNPIFNCSLDSECEVPKSAKGDVYLKVFKTGDIKSPIIVHLQDNQHFQPDCQYEIICMCTADPCPCDLYLYPIIGTYGLIKLTKVDQRPKKAFMLQKVSNVDNLISHNKTHLTLKYEQKDYSIGYKRLNGDPTSRSYKHLSRYGDQFDRSFSIRSGKYALGNNINTEENLSEIRKILKLQSERLVKYVVLWKRDNMKTVITINNMTPNQWKVDTYSAAEAGKLEDLYFEVSAPHIINNKKIYTDSNGWLVMKRQMFKHEDYQAHFSPQKYDDVDGNSYPMTAFTYIMNEDGSQKLSVNTDRPQGVTGIKPGSIWINFDRLTSDDGKWVYETAYRAEYQKFSHYITVNNVNNNQRIIQKMIDEPLLIQGQSPSIPNIKYSNQGLTLTETRKTWEQKSGIHRVKFQVKPWNDSSLILRVFNMWDDKQTQIQLFSADNISTFLTAYYGNQLHFMDVYETNMAGNIRYQDFIAKKWNWNNITNLDKENNIFNKEFGQNIKLRPLEIRTFVFDGVSFSKGCKQLKSLRYTNKTEKFIFNTSKPAPARSEKDKLNEKRAAEYLYSGDHCKQISPVKDKTYKIDPQIVAIPDVISKEHELPKMKNPSIANERPLSEEIQYPQQPQQPQSQFQPQPQPQKPQPQPQPQSQSQSPSQSQSQSQPKPQPQSASASPSTSTSTSGKSGQFDWKAKLIEYKILTRDQKQMYFNNKLVELKQKLNKETKMK